MAHETVVLLRSLLYQAKRAKTKKEIIRAIEVMCTKDDVAAVAFQIAEAIKEEAAEEAEAK